VPRFGPVYDAHMHVEVEDPEQVLRYLDTCAIEKAVVLNGGWSRDSPNLEHERSERIGYELLERYPTRFAVFSTVDFSHMDEPDFVSGAVAHFEQTVLRGASGLKLLLGKPDSHWMALDDPRVGALYDKAAEMRVPVTVHVGDPAAFWERNSPDSFWYGVLRKCPHWDYRGKPVPSREQLFEEQRRMLDKHPDTVFICAHMGGRAESLGNLGDLLDRYANLYVDTTAYEPLMGQDPQESRAFLVKYQDRVLFGTDNCPGSPVDALSSAQDLRIAVLRMRTRRLFYETDSEQVNLDGFWLRRPGYTIKGVNLPAAVISKIYRENACRLIPRLGSYLKES